MRPELFVEKTKLFGLDTAGSSWAVTNNLIWQLIFEHSRDTTMLDQGIKWAEIIKNQYPEYPDVIDTYANLLYKVGRKSEAIKWQTVAMNIEQESASKQNREISSVYKETLHKMQQNIPTWPNP